MKNKKDAVREYKTIKMGELFSEDSIEACSQDNIIKYHIFFGCDFLDCNIRKYAFYRCSFYDCIFVAPPLIHDKCVFNFSNMIENDKEFEEYEIALIKTRLDNSYTSEQSAHLVDLVKKDGGKFYGAPSASKPFIIPNKDQEIADMKALLSGSDLMAVHLKNTRFNVMSDEDFEKLDNDPHVKVIGRAEVDLG